MAGLLSNVDFMDPLSGGSGESGGSASGDRGQVDPEDLEGGLQRAFELLFFIIVNPKVWIKVLHQQNQRIKRNLK